MSQQNINDFIKDYNDDMQICDICSKYNIGYTTYFKILKKANVNRRISSKTNKLFNVIVEKKEADVKQVYHKPINESDITVVKKQPIKKDKEIKDPTINKAFNEAKQCIYKVQDKYVKKGCSDDKSELLQAINKSNDLRLKILNKKN